MKKQIELPLENMVNTHKVRTPYNRPSSGSTGQKFKMLSLTVPDMSLSVQSILERHSKGLPISAHVHIPIYDEVETDGIKLETLDLTELQALRDANKVSISEYQRIIREENDRIRKESQEAREKEFKEFLEKNAPKKETGKVDLSTNNP